jgi:hypothetical protein
METILLDGEARNRSSISVRDRRFSLLHSARMNSGVASQPPMPNLVEIVQLRKKDKRSYLCSGGPARAGERTVQLSYTCTGARGSCSATQEWRAASACPSSSAC